MKDKVAMMLGKKEFKPIESEHQKFNAKKIIEENAGEFKSSLEAMKIDLKSKLPKK